MNRFICTIVIAYVCFAVFAAKPVDTLHSSQLCFVPNLGQWSGPFSYKASLNGGAIFFDTAGYLVSMVDPLSLNMLHEIKTNGLSAPELKINTSSYKVVFLGKSSQAKFISIVPPYSFHYNYFLSHTSDCWRSNVPVYSSISLLELYDGVDMLVSQSDNNVKFDFLIAPNVDPTCIKMQYSGVRNISIVSNSLIIDNGLSRVVEMAPYAYQISAEGDTLVVPCSYVLKNNVVSFHLGDYNNSLPLVIDPVVVFSSYSGSVADNWGYTATYDSYGNLYGGGIAFGVGYPTTLGVFQSEFCDGTGNLLTDVAISKFDSTGSSLLYSTYLGGSYVDIPHSLFVNENDELYVLGTTGSPDFPVTPNAYDTSFNAGSNITLSTDLKFLLGSDIFISKFSKDADILLASTFVGGSSNDGINTSSFLRKNYADDNRGEILVDENSNVYVVSSTFSEDFPTTVGAFNTSFSGGQDACVFKMSPDLSQLVWSTFLGGLGDDAGYSMSITRNHEVYVCGGTNSADFPIVSPAFQISLNGAVDGFVAHISENGHQLLHSTYCGKEGYDQAYLIKGNKDDFPHVFGQTDASNDSWINNAPYSIPNGGQFLLKLTPDLESSVWSTSFGTGNGGPDISPTALMVDYCNNIYLSGWGSYPLNGFGGTSGLPITDDAFQSTTDGSDYYFMSLSDDASQLIYGTFFGGAAPAAREHVDGGTSRFDRKGRIYQAVCAGCGGQSTFPTTPGAFSTANGSSNCNLGVIKMDFSLPVVVADFHMPNSVCAPDTVLFQNFSQTIGSNTSYFWDFGDGTTSYEREPSHFFNHSGYYPITLIVHDVGSCNFSDTLTKSLLVLANTKDTLSPVSVCDGDIVQIGLPPSNAVTYQWSPSVALSNPALSNPYSSTTQPMWYSLIASSETCTDTIWQFVVVDTLQVTMTPDTVICAGDSVLLSANVPSGCDFLEWSDNSSFSSAISNQTSIMVAPATRQTYYFKAIRGVCDFVGSVTVSVSDIHVSPLPDVLICFEDSVELSANHTGGADCSYVWSVGADASYTQSHPWVSPASSTEYSVVITNSNGCSASASGNIVKREGTFPTPFSAWCNICEIVQAHSTTVYSTAYGTGYSYQWSPTQEMETPNQSSSEVHPMETTEYVVSVIDEFGCKMTDSVTIKVSELTCDDPFIFIPNAFSPNGDGKNDILYVRSEIVEDFYFVVYSRWGEKVFECTNLEAGWDGTYKGKPCQNGVYDYYFSGTCFGGKTKELKGNVMLVR